MAEDIHDIGALLGAPVRAIQEAQIGAEREYLAFLLDYGLEEVKERVDGRQVSTLRLREVSFGMNRTVADPASPGGVIDTVATVREPLVSLVQMPAVGIAEATVDLTLDVTTEGRSAAEAEGPRGALLPPRAGPAAALRGRIGSGQISRSFRTEGRLTVRMTLRASHADDVHGRLSRILAEGLSATINVPDKG
jgi:hypothetical protein